MQLDIAGQNSLVDLAPTGYPQLNVAERQGLDVNGGQTNWADEVCKNRYIAIQHFSRVFRLANLKIQPVICLHISQICGPMITDVDFPLGLPKLHSRFGLSNG